MLEVLCRCCGVPVEGMRAQVRVCPICDVCDGKHGDELQALVGHGVVTGQIEPGKALCRMLVDDAHLTGRIIYVEREGSPLADITIPDPPPRWLVVCGRAAARGQLPDLQTVVNVVLAQHLPCGRDQLPALQRELREALTFVDPSIMDVAIDCRIDAECVEHVVINVSGRAVSPDLVVDMAKGADVEISHDILSRARGQA